MENHRIDPDGKEKQNDNPSGGGVTFRADTLNIDFQRVETTSTQRVLCIGNAIRLTTTKRLRIVAGSATCVQTRKALDFTSRCRHGQKYASLSCNESTSARSAFNTTATTLGRAVQAGIASLAVGGTEVGLEQHAFAVQTGNQSRARTVSIHTTRETRRSVLIRVEASKITF
jgi:hypothetical protein